jgi:Family of unknown function (DUF5946)
MNHLQQQYNDLSFYTLSLQDAAFIHQHIVDAYTAQTAGESTKPISIIFALAGLLLHVEKGYTGREVQLFHMKMAKNKIPWPVIVLPEKRGDITVADVLAAAPGAQRNGLIHLWCTSVWEAYKDSSTIIRQLVNQYAV